jgi:hypothetical protein
MAFTPDILIGNTNTYQVVGFRDAITLDLETGVEMYLSLCLSPPSGRQMITNATNTNPIVVTSADHGLADDDVITIINVGGNGAAKGTFAVTVIDDDSFSLDGSTGDGDYTGGGQWFQCLAETDGLTMGDEGDGLYSIDIDGSIGLNPQQVYIVIFYCLGAYRDVFNDVVRVVARVRGSS